MADLFDSAALRSHIPAVIGVLVRRGADFAAAEDAVQEALLEALGSWPKNAPRDPRAWLITVAWRKFLDATRSESARREREFADAQPDDATVPSTDDTLELYFLCAHEALTPASAVALTLRAVGGLTTKQIADAYLVPEATMAQRISRAKRTIADAQLRKHGDLSIVLRVLYLVFNEGYSGSVDLSAEAIRLTGQLRSLSGEPEISGLLALMLLHDARRASRTDPHGRLVPLAEQDRTRWDTRQISTAVVLLQDALTKDQLGEYQAQAAIAALHADARTVQETDWVQIVSWYDELMRITGSPVVALNRAIAVGEADGAPAGLAALADIDPATPRYTAARAYLTEKNGERTAAAGLYAEAAHAAGNLAERDHLTRQAVRLRRGS